MNGLKIVDLEDPGLVDRLLSRRPRENGFLEVQNIIASMPVDEIQPSFIRERLELHGIDPQRARPRLLSLYKLALESFITDRRLDDEEMRILSRMKFLLGLEDEDVRQITLAASFPLFEESVRTALADGRLSAEEATFLRRFQRSLCIEDDVAWTIQGRQASPVVSAAASKAISDRRLTPDEEAELRQLARNLGVEPFLFQYDSGVLDRCRSLWQMATGHFKFVPVDVALEPGEACACNIPARAYDLLGPVRAACHSGYAAGSGAQEIRFRSGYIPQRSILSEKVRFVDEGMLYFTTERLLFQGAHIKVVIALDDLFSATFCADGMILESNNGNQVVIQAQADMEGLHAGLDGLMTLRDRSRPTAGGDTNRPVSPS